jgi:hypothetical protein
MQRVFLLNDCLKSIAMHAVSAAAIAPAVGAGLLLQHLTTKEGVSMFFAAQTAGVAKRWGRSLAYTNAIAGGVAVYWLWMTTSPLPNIVVVAGGLIFLAWWASAGVIDRAPRCFGARGTAGGIINAKPTGNHDVDCHIGDLGGRRVVGEMIRTHCPEVLVYALRDIIKRGRYTGIEIGFLMHIALALLSSETKLDEYAKHREVQALVRAG